MRFKSIIELTRRRRNKTIPKKSRYIAKPHLKLREKVRPVGQDDFNVEVRLLPLTDIPEAVRWGRTGFLGPKAHERYDAWIDLESIIRQMVGGRYKIIEHRGRAMLNIKILLEREEDLMILVLAQSELITKTYRYV